MKKKITSIVKKSAKVGAAVCVAAGAVALMTSGAALKALTEGAKYLKIPLRRSSMRSLNQKLLRRRKSWNLLPAILLLKQKP